MKAKFVLTLLSLGCAIAAQAAEPVYSWEWTTEGATISADGWHNSFTYVEGEDHASFTSSSSPWITSMPAMTGSFTVSFDVKNLSTTNSNWNSIICLYSNGTTSGNGNSLQLQFDTQGNLHLYNQVGGATGFGGNTTGSILTGLTSADLQKDEWTSFSIVSDLTTNTLSVYVNGTSVGSVADWNPTSPALTGAQFGTAFGSGGHSLNGSIDINNIKFYNEAVHPASENIPEPTTATLSLLALAGLAARRRRK